MVIKPLETTTIGHQFYGLIKSHSNSSSNNISNIIKTKIMNYNSKKIALILTLEHLPQ